MEKFFIEAEDKRLYSVYYESAKFSNQGVVLCYPLGQEYIRCHRFYNILAEKISALGFHVIKFDYSGTGDSKELLTPCKISNFLDDLSIIYNEFKNVCSLDSVNLFGTRFGGLVSVLFALKNKIKNLILISPCFDGNIFVDEMINYHNKWINGAFVNKKNTDHDIIEILGFAYQKDFIKELRRVYLWDEIENLDNQMLLIDTITNEQLREVNCKNLNIKPLRSGNFWERTEGNMEKGIVPVNEIDIILNWLSSK